MKNIEEDIKYLKLIRIEGLEKIGYVYAREAIDNVLADREEWKTKAEWFKRCCNKNFDTANQLQAKANKYDSLVEKAKEKIILHKEYLSNQAVTSNPTLDAHYRDVEKQIIQTLQELLDTNR